MSLRPASELPRETNKRSKVQMFLLGSVLAIFFWIVFVPPLPQNHLIIRPYTQY